MAFWRNYGSPVLVLSDIGTMNSYWRSGASREIVRFRCWCARFINNLPWNTCQVIYLRNVINHQHDMSELYNWPMNHLTHHLWWKSKEPLGSNSSVDKRFRKPLFDKLTLIDYHN
ncbi:hypothetical protein OCU04_000463 [Sclerotinia nivalis]|uniref:Uncharacterized protein n=1 Tax=Sclerotinia nivalis TaxID=352851 RepID=A0A9X0DNF6_9HELO|nr:hypothetical protein OCU04_000463 [Sclerotinia nivalis]